eukprot:gene6387-7041_t
MRIVRYSYRTLAFAALSRAFIMRRFLVNTKAPASAAEAVIGTAKPAASLRAATTATAAVSIPAIVQDSSPDQAVATPSTSSLTTTVTSQLPPNASFAEQLKASELPSGMDKYISWQAGESIPYSVVVSTFEEVSQRSGRLDKEALLTRLFRCVLATTPADLEAVVYITFNQVHPVYDGLELGVGDSLLVKAICEATGRKKDAVEEDYEREGDLGVVALASRSSQKTLSFVAKPKPLTASAVLEQFRNITSIKGDKAQARKVEVIKNLLVKCQGQEAKYIVRALQGKLRIGLAEQTVLVSLSHAFLDAQQQVKAAASMESDELVDCSESESESVSGGKKSRKTQKKTKKAVAVAVEEEDSPSSASAGDVEEMGLQDLLSRVSEAETPEGRLLRLYLTGSSRLPRDKAYEAAEQAVKRAFSECPNLTLLLAALSSYPIYQLYTHCKLHIGIPVAPMLAKPTKAVAEVLSRLSGLAFTMEYKYDGERAQVHLLEDGTVKIFSRNSEDNTEKYPDLRQVVRDSRTEHVTSAIIDAEVVAYDREKGQLLPFQILSTRKRKQGEGEEEQKVKVILQAFDLLYLNGQSVLRESLRTRRALLRKAFSHTEAFLHFASGADHVEDGDTAPIETFLTEACASMCEGLMVKTLDDRATYEPSKRSLNWLKLKKDYITGMGVCDSVDLVPIGGYLGRGKRVNTYGAYLMACYDPDRDEYQSVCKVGTGFKDEDLERLTNQLRGSALIPSKKKPVNFNVSEALYPDDWFEAGSIVWEIQAADLSRSSVHRGGLGRLDGEGRGIGLRFPRFLRERDDKRAELATTSEQIVDMFFSQATIEGNGKAKEGGDDDEEDEGI